MRPPSAHDPQQILPVERYTACGGVARSFPDMNKDCAALAWRGVGPIVVCDDKQIIHAIRPAQRFVAERIIAPGARLVVTWVLWVVGPDVGWPNGADVHVAAPRPGAGDAVGAVSCAHQAKGAGGGAAIAFDLALDNSAPTY